jgi:cysteine desulfurase
MTDKAVLVSVMYANNEVGTIQPLRHIAALVDKHRRLRGPAHAMPLYFHTDASQAANYLDLHVSRLGVDLMTLNAGKMYGPKGAGVLYAASHVRLQPQVMGGGQERGYRSGTENVPAIVGLAAALDLVQSGRKTEAGRLAGLQQRFINGLQASMPQATINGSRRHRLPNNIHVTFPGQDNERLQILLDEAGIFCATGSACSASKEQASHVLAALGMDDASARASLRFSLGRPTSEHDIDRTLTELKRIVS